MHREFEELGVSVAGIDYGFFAGEAEFDQSRQPVVIHIEPNAATGKALTLAIDDLVRERIALRRKLGVGFLEDGGHDVREHLKKWVLFQTLSDSLVSLFEDDIRDLLAERRAGHAA